MDHGLVELAQKPPHERSCEKRREEAKIIGTGLVRCRLTSVPAYDTCLTTVPCKSHISGKPEQGKVPVQVMQEGLCDRQAGNNKAFLLRRRETKQPMVLSEYSKQLPLDILAGKMQLLNPSFILLQMLGHSHSWASGHAGWQTLGIQLQTNSNKWALFEMLLQLFSAQKLSWYILKTH